VATDGNESRYLEILLHNKLFMRVVGFI